MAMLHVIFRRNYRESENTLINAEKPHKTSKVKFTCARAFQMLDVMNANNLNRCFKLRLKLGVTVLFCGFLNLKRSHQSSANIL